MSDNKTVTHKGNVYEIGKHYLFGNSYQLHKLLKINTESDYPFRVLDEGQENGFTKIHLVDLDEGTITPAPIELIDGNAYTFDYFSEKDLIGVYSKSWNVLLSLKKQVQAIHCTNIRPMTVKESK